MSKLNEKQMLIATIAGAAVLTLAFGGLTYMDYQNIYGAEITDSNPDAASIADDGGNGPDPTPANNADTELLGHVWLRVTPRGDDWADNDQLARRASPVAPPGRIRVTATLRTAPTQSCTLRSPLGLGV